MDSERGYLELRLLYMERRFNIYSIIWRYLQIFEDIIIFFWRYLQIIETTFNYMKIPSNNEHMLK